MTNIRQILFLLLVTGCGPSEPIRIYREDDRWCWLQNYSESIHLIESYRDPGEIVDELRRLQRECL